MVRRSVDVLAGIIIRNGKILVRERPAKGIWGGLWELPSVISSNGKNASRALTNELEKTYGMKLEAGEKLPPMVHHLTHLKMTIRPHVFTVKSSAPLPLSSPMKWGRNEEGVRWITKSDLKRLSFPVPYQKLLNSAFSMPNF